jgi:hypothetical protein
LIDRELGGDSSDFVARGRAFAASAGRKVNTLADLIDERSKLVWGVASHTTHPLSPRDLQI